jgi:acetoin utilization deacetylase AcuC-like enzyme
VTAGRSAVQVQCCAALEVSTTGRLDRETKGCTPNELAGGHGKLHYPLPRDPFCYSHVTAVQVGISSLKAFYSDHFVLPLPSGHRFPMQKYRLVREGAVAANPDLDLCEAPRCSDGELALAHHPAWIGAVSRGELTAAQQRQIGFPWSERMAERSRRSAGATIAGCRAALEEGVAVNLAGGTHHAHADHGEGFCVFNDAAVAARLMQAERRVRNVAVVDLDVHQGNGTASILANDDSVFTLSVHGENNYPFKKETSDLDVALPDDTGDDAYLDALEQALAHLFSRFAPQLIIYLAGADPHEGDRLGRLKLSFAGLATRDHMVLGQARARGIPVAIAMAGGYGRDIADTVRGHLQTIALAAAHAPARQFDLPVCATGKATSSCSIP